MNLNSVWAMEKAAPVFRSGVVVIRQFVLLHHGAENRVNTQDRPLYILKHYQPQVLVKTIIEK